MVTIHGESGKVAGQPKGSAARADCKVFAISLLNISAKFLFDILFQIIQHAI